jgi:hypothetical protein
MPDPASIAVVEPPVQAPEPVAPVPAPVSDPNDPFSVDEARLSTFAPEQRAVLDEWKKKASETIEARGKTSEEKYKGHVEKATALDQLTRHPEFQKWWASQQKGPTSDITPQDVATAEEWSTAVIDASNGQPQKLQELNMKMWAQKATPIVQQLQQKQQQLEMAQQQFTMTQQMKSLWERYPDAKDLDQIGRNPDDPTDKTPSLLEIAMSHVVDQQGKSIEEGYHLARKWADALNKTAKQVALGITQEKKGAVTAGPSTSQVNSTVVEVDSFEELTRKNMEALMSGQTPPRYVIKGSKK